MHNRHKSYSTVDSKCNIDRLASTRWTERQQVTAPWQKWRFRTPKIVLWIQKVQFSASTFMLKSPPIANLQTVMHKLGKTL